MKFLNRFKRKSNSEQPLAKAPEKAASGSQNPALRPAVYPQKRVQPESDEIKLELGDFLHRIPQNLLVDGPHDPATELRFEIQDLSNRISNGQTTISVAEIYKRIPQIFRGEILESDNIEVRFPWQKLAKLVNLSGPGKNAGLQPDAAATALAEKLRAKKTSTAPQQANTAAPHDAGKTSAPVLPGHGDRAGSWFSRPTIERPSDVIATTISATSLPVLPVVKPAPEKEPQMRLVMPEPEQAAKSTKSAPAAEAAAKAMIQDLREPDMSQDLQRKIAAVQGEYERQFAELEKQRKLLIEARDASNAEVLKLRQQLERVQEDLGAEKTATEVSQDMLAKAASERNAIQAKLDSHLAELSAVREELATLRDSSKFVELAAERDALLQQKAHLTSQISEMGKRVAPASGNPIPSGNGGSGARQLEEAQRRIAGLEASQRETALELSREKEARSKVEKLLIAAEKLQEQSANYMESTKAEIRKEIEASVKQRESELRKTQKELQDQVATLSDQARKTATELENARSRANALEQQLTSGGHAPAAPLPDPLQTQAIEQLEADIEQYRSRLKALIAERDSARAEAEEARKQGGGSNAHSEALEKAQTEIASLQKLQSELQESHARERDQLHSEKEALTGKIQTEAAAREELFTTLDHDHTSVVRANEELTRRLAEAEKSLRELEAQRASASEVGSVTDASLLAELTNLREQHAQTLRSRDEALAQAESRGKAQEESEKTLQQLATEQQQLLAQLQSERDQVSELRRNLETVSQELSSLRDQHHALTDLLKNEHGNLSATLTSEQSKATQLAEQLAAAEAHAQALRDQCSSATQAHETALEEKHKLLATLADLEKSHTEALLSLTQERDQARTEREALGAELSSARKQHQHLIVSFEEDRAALATARETIQKKLAALEQHRSELTGTLQARENLIADLEQKHQQAHETHQSSYQELEGRLASANELLTSKETAHAEAQQQAAAQIDELKRANAALEHQIAESRSEIEALSRKITELEASSTSAHAALQQAEKTITESAEKAASQAETASREIAELQRALDEVRNAHRETTAELEAKSQSHTEISASLDAERGKHHAARTELESIASKLASHEAALTDAKSAHEQLLKSASESAAQANREIEQLRKTHDEAAEALRAKEQAHAELTSGLENERNQHSAARSELEATAKRLSETEAALTNAQSAHQQELAAATKRLTEAEAALASAQSAHQQELAAAAKRLTETESALADARTARQELEQKHAASTEAAHAEVEKLTTDLTQLRAAHDHAASELNSLKKAHGELASGLEHEKNLHTNTRTKLDETTLELSKRTEEAREKAQGYVSEIEQLKKSSESAVQEQQAKFAALQQASDESATKLKADLDELRVALQIARRERDETRQQSEATIIDLQNRSKSAEDAVAALQEKLEASAGERDSAVAALRAAREEHDSTIRQRDDLADRIKHITDRHRRLIEDLGGGLFAAEAAPAPAPAPRPQAPAVPVIEVHNPEVFAPESGNGISLPRIRPVPIPPPRVQSQ